MTYLVAAAACTVNGMTHSVKLTDRSVQVAVVHRKTTNTVLMLLLLLLLLLL